MRADLPSLTSLRAFAALGVFLFHLGAYGLPYNAHRAGYVGVAFFFVLSGFVLTWNVHGPVDLRRFWVRRVARIYPAHIAIWLVILVLPVTTGVISLGQALTNLTLVQAWIPSERFAYSMNGVTWSLACEVFFYLLFPLLVAVARRTRTRVLWAAAGTLFLVSGVVVVTIAQTMPGETWAAFAEVNPLVHLNEFVLGIVAALSVRRGHRLPWQVVAATLLVCVGGAVLMHEKPALNVWATPVFVVLIVLVVQIELRRDFWLGHRWLVYAGTVSFAFYLVHQRVIVWCDRAVGDGYLSAAIALPVSAVLAVALHHLIEKPAHRVIVRRWGATKRTVASDPVNG